METDPKTAARSPNNQNQPQLLKLAAAFGAVRALGEWLSGGSSALSGDLFGSHKGRLCPEARALGLKFRLAKLPAAKPGRAAEWRSSWICVSRASGRLVGGSNLELLKPRVPLG